MRATGIVRRMDELGRVVIPKELRRTMRIREGEELEVFTTEDNALVLKKFSAVKEMAGFFGEYASSIYRTTGYTAIIADNDRILAVSGDIRVCKIGDTFSVKGEQLKNERRSLLLNGREVAPVFGEPTLGIEGQVIAPIVAGGDVMGAVILLSKRELGELALKTAETAAGFFATQL